MPEMAEKALAYARQGFFVFPLHFIRDGRCSCNTRCSSPGKHPLARLAPRGVKDATVDPAKIKDWWQVIPSANIGIATGEQSKLVVIDVDQGGAAGLQSLLDAHGTLPKTLSVSTPGGGYHFYFQYPESGAIANSASLLAPGIDVRGEGGYVVAPPSSHMGGTYQWTFKAFPATLPDWLRSLLLQREYSQAKLPLAERPSEFIPSGQRNSTLTSFGGYMRRAGFPKEAIEAALHELNAIQCDPPLPDAEVRLVASSVSRYHPSISLVTSPEKDRHLVTDTSELMREVTRAIEFGEVHGVNTGISGIDTLLGGLTAGELNVIAARPSVGKTALATTIAQHVGERYTVLVFSAEMSRRAIGMRMISSETGISSVELKLAMRGRHLSPAQYDAIRESAERLSGLNILWVDESSISIDRIHGYTINVVSDHALSLIVVDYMQLLRAEGEGRESQVAAISMGLKALAMDFDVPVIALAQLNRDIERRPMPQRRPMLSDLRNSGQIEQDADVVMFIHRPDKQGAESVNVGGRFVPATNVAELIVAKNRNGPVGICHLLFDPVRMVFRDYQEGIMDAILTGEVLSVPPNDLVPF